MDSLQQKSAHFWRIHARVAKRAWADLPLKTRDIIAADAEHETPEYKWFEAKLVADVTRLYEDPSYYDNDPFTFGHNKHEDWLPTAA